MTFTSGRIQKSHKTGANGVLAPIYTKLQDVTIKELWTFNCHRCANGINNTETSHKHFMKHQVVYFSVEMLIPG